MRERARARDFSCNLRRKFATLSQVAEWFAPSVGWLLKCVPFFFAPPLIQLPVALAPLPPSSIFKMLLVVVSGSFVGCLATGICVERIWGCGGVEPKLVPIISRTELHYASARCNTRSDARNQKKETRAATSSNTSGATAAPLPTARAADAGGGLRVKTSRPPLVAVTAVIVVALVVALGMAWAAAPTTEAYAHQFAFLLRELPEQVDSLLILLASLATLRLGQV